MDENKVVQFPTDDAEDLLEKVEGEQVNEPKKLIEDPDNPLENMAQIESMLKNTEALVKIVEQNWLASSRELDITEAHVRQLAVWNDNHKKEMPMGLSEEEKDNWDHWNGLDCLTEEEIERIFGKEHKIYGLSHEATIDRIKGACNDFLSWLTMMREYRSIHDAYLQLLETEEEKEIVELREAAEEEKDEEKRKVMLASIDNYYKNKYLGFLAEPFSDFKRDRLLKALSDQKKLEYWIKRSRDKLGQMKISTKFILEISQFEKRFLDEKYHKNNNMLLVWFLNECAFCDASKPTDESRIRVVCTVMAMDGIIRKVWAKEKTDIVMKNICAFEDQFLPYTKEPDHEITPPIVEEVADNGKE